MNSVAYNIYFFSLIQQLKQHTQFTPLYFRMLKEQSHPSYTRRGRRGCDRMVVGFTTTYAISAYHH